LPSWIKVCHSRMNQRLVRFFTRFGLRASPFDGIDVFNHFNFIIHPLHARVNVLTLADLTTLRVPEFHTKGTLAWQRSAYTLAPQMDLIITISEHSKRDVVELLGIAPDRVRVTPLAAHRQYRPLEDHQRIRDVRAQYGLAD